MFLLNSVSLSLVTKLCLTLATPWTVARQTPLSMGFFRQEYWSGLPILPPRDLSDPGIEPASPASPALAGRLLTTEPSGEPHTRGTINNSRERGQPRKRSRYEQKGTEQVHSKNNIVLELQGIIYIISHYLI